MNNIPERGAENVGFVGGVDTLDELMVVEEVVNSGRARLVERFLAGMIGFNEGLDASKCEVSITGDGKVGIRGVVMNDAVIAAIMVGKSNGGEVNISGTIVNWRNGDKCLDFCVNKAYFEQVLRECKAQEIAALLGEDFSRRYLKVKARNKAACDAVENRAREDSDVWHGELKKRACAWFDGKLGDKKGEGWHVYSVALMDRGECVVYVGGGQNTFVSTCNSDDDGIEDALKKVGVTFIPGDPLSTGWVGFPAAELGCVEERELADVADEVSGHVGQAIEG